MSQEHSLKEHELHVPVNGKTITFKTGKIARQAGAAVVVQCGETILLTTVCAAPKPTENIDFLPLKVDYQEKFSSSGKTLGGFIKREGRQTEREVLVSRLIDRPIRPLFEDGYHKETQLLSYVFSYDGINSPEPLAICGASAALVLSDIPFIKPIGAVRVGLIGDRFIINPSTQEQKESRLDLLLAGSEDAILMIEGYCDFLTEEQILSAIEEGHGAIKIICKHLSDWQKMLGKQKDRSSLKPCPKQLIEEITQNYEGKLQSAFSIQEKLARELALDGISAEIKATYPIIEGETPYSATDIGVAFKAV